MTTTETATTEATTESGSFPTIVADWSAPDGIWGTLLADAGGTADAASSPNPLAGIVSSKFTCPPATGMCRAEFQKTGLSPYGAEQVYEWLLYVPSSSEFPGNGGHASFIQFKNSLACFNSGFDASNGQYLLRINVNNVCTGDHGPRTEIPLAPLVRDRWTAFRLHVKWHADASVGFVHMWADYDLRDGLAYRETVPFTRLQTSSPLAGEHKLRLGLYRQACSCVTVFYGDGMAVDVRS